MRIMRRRVIGVAISTVSLLVTTSVFALSTTSDTAKAATTANAATTAIAATYDNQWPDETSCGRTAVTVKTTSTATGLLELRYSTACRTVWARLSVYPDAFIEDPQCWVVRNSDGRTTAGIVKMYNDDTGSTVAFSEMLNDAGVTSHASADWTTSEGHHTASTASY